MPTTTNLGSRADGAMGETHADREVLQPHSAPPGDVSWSLDARGTHTVIRTRTLLNGAMTALGVAGRAVEDAELVGAELVGNAVQHAVPPVELHLEVRETETLVRVVDGSPLLPEFPPAPADDWDVDADDFDPEQLVAALNDRGRGLGIVDHLSAGRCGAYRTVASDGTQGKVVWSLLETAGGEETAE